MPPLPDSVAKLALIDPHHANLVVESKPSFLGGYPLPGPQSITGAAAMNKTSFVDENTWRILAEHGKFDDIVVGSGFCALAYIRTALDRDPDRKILLLERGGFWLQDHVQNLPAPFQLVRDHLSETFPWELSYNTAENNHYLSGSSPFFGGRSSFWSIWCPRAIGQIDGVDYDLMDDFPTYMKDVVKDFYEQTDHMLHVQPADKILDPVFKAFPLQGRVKHYLDAALIAPVAITGAIAVETARLATGLPLFGPSSQGYRHFSVIASLLARNEHQNKLAEKKLGSPIMIATDTIVERFEVEEDSPSLHARILHTSRGPLTLHGGKTNVILAAGAIPNTTILLNSSNNEVFKRRAGQRLTAHFRSKVMARFKIKGDGLSWLDADQQAALPKKHPVISAHHVRGKHSNPVGGDGDLQWHIQVNGIYVPEGDQEGVVGSLQGMLPDLWLAPTGTQLENSGGYVVLSCSVLGELPPNPDGSYLEFLEGPGRDVTTNIRLSLELTLAAKALWGAMEDNTFEAIEAIAAPTTTHVVLEYWNAKEKKWEQTADPQKEVHTKRVKPLFHEASTTYMRSDPGDFDDETEVGDTEADRPTVNNSYRPLGLQEGNVYVTGAGLFPTAGSWNPTPTICALAQHLATTLVDEMYHGRAVLNVLDGTRDTWFFNGNKYVRIKWTPGNPNGQSIVYDSLPDKFENHWKTSLKQTGFRQIDAFIRIPSGDKEFYVFSGTRYARIQFGLGGVSERIIRLPNDSDSITRYWRSLRDVKFTTISGALIDPSDDNRIYFFSGDKYVHVNFNSTDNMDTVVDNTGPRPITQLLPWFPEGRKLSTIFPDPRTPSNVYVISGHLCWRFNFTAGDKTVIAGPQYVAAVWPILGKDKKVARTARVASFY